MSSRAIMVDRADPTGAYGSRVEKVAIVLSALQNSLAVDLLKKFNPEDVKAIIQFSNKLKPLNVGDVDPLVDEFIREFSEALGISAGPDKIMALLESAFGSDETAAILGKKVETGGVSVWTKFTPGIEKSLAPSLLDESEQLSAFIMTNLPRTVAARTMEMLPRTSQARIAARMVKMVKVDADVQKIVEETLQEDFFSFMSQSNDTAKIDQLAAVINQLDAEKSEAVLTDMASVVPEETKALRKLIFMFNNIQEMDQQSCSKLLDRVPTEVLIPALYGIAPEFREKLLSSIGQRTRRMIESELTEGVDQPIKETAEAQRKVADMAIDMSKRGELQLPTAA